MYFLVNIYNTLKLKRKGMSNTKFKTVVRHKVSCVGQENGSWDRGSHAPGCLSSEVLYKNWWLIQASSFLLFLKLSVCGTYIILYL